MHPTPAAIQASSGGSDFERARHSTTAPVSAAGSATAAVFPEAAKAPRPSTRDRSAGENAPE
jgi:hypothetical protein